MLLQSKDTQRPLTVALALGLALLAGCNQANRAEQEAAATDTARAQSSSGPVLAGDDKAKLSNQPSAPPESVVMDMPFHRVCV